MKKILLFLLISISTYGQADFPEGVNITGKLGVNTTSPVGNFTVFTGTSGVTTNFLAQQNGSISFSNAGSSTASPIIGAKSNDAPGLVTIAATNNTNPLYDMAFEVRENDETDFSTLSSVAFSFRRYTNPLINIFRNGNSEFTGQIKSNNYITDSGDYLVGTKSKTAIASFYNNKVVTAHANYGFLEDSDLNYSGVAVQGHASFNDNIHIIGVQDSDHHHSYQSYPHYGNSGTLTDLKGFWMQPDVTAGNVTRLYEFEANNPLGSGVINELVGLRVRPLTRGAANWAVYTEGSTPSFMNGNVYFGSKVGVGGTLTPTANLEVIDTDKAFASPGNVTIRSTDAAAIDKGGYLTLGGSFNGTTRTSFGGIASKKENATNNNIAGYTSIIVSDAALGLVEAARFASNKNVSFNGKATAAVAASSSNDLERKGEHDADLALKANNTLTGYVSGAGTVSATDTVLQAIQKLNGNDAANARPYKVYTALMNQTGTSAPTVTIMENTLGGTITWSYSSAGYYIGTLTGAFTANKTTVSTTLGAQVGTVPVKVSSLRASVNTVEVYTVSNGSAADGMLSSAFFEVRVYN